MFWARILEGKLPSCNETESHKRRKKKGCGDGGGCCSEKKKRQKENSETDEVCVVADCISVDSF